MLLLGEMISVLNFGGKLPHYQRPASSQSYYSNWKDRDPEQVPFWTDLIQLIFLLTEVGRPVVRIYVFQIGVVAPFQQAAVESMLFWPDDMDTPWKINMSPKKGLFQ